MNCKGIKKMFGILLSVGSTVSVIASVLAVALAQPVGADEKQPILVEAVSVTYQPYTQKIHTSGILTYKSQQNLSFKTAGSIGQLTVREGDQIIRGQLLASLRLEEIKAQVDEAEARVLLAKNNLKRYSVLHRSNALSLEQLQSAETELAVAQTKLRIARFNHQYSSIHAPSDGLVLRRFVEDNELVNAYQPVLKIADTDQGWVIRVGVTDRDIVRMSLGDRADIQFDIWPQRLFIGSVTELATLADEHTGTFKVDITIEDDITINDGNSLLRSGFVGKVSIEPTHKKTVALIPLESVVYSTAQTAEVFVYDPEHHTVSKRSIHMSLAEPGYIVSESGLMPKELVVSKGAGLLRDGDYIRISAAGE